MGMRRGGEKEACTARVIVLEEKHGAVARLLVARPRRRAQHGGLYWVGSTARRKG